MGGFWDLFGVRPVYGFEAISIIQKANRKLLREIMVAHEFLPYDKEWWHFSLKTSLTQILILTLSFLNKSYSHYSILTPCFL